MKNEAAERLRELIETGTVWRPDVKMIDAALAEERSHVIAEIREHHKTCTVSGCHVPRILDEVERAGRE